MTRAGFVGLGQIGLPMARRLEDPVVYDVRLEATEGFARRASTLEEVAEEAEVISVMVRDDAQVREVVAGMLPAARPGAVIAVHSTISPATAEELAGASGRIHVVDAPVSGGAIGAAEGTLAVMVGGATEAVERCREVFARWASLFVPTGPPGSATRMKLARNVVTFVSFAAALEAQRLAEASGLDLAALAEVVRHSDAVTGGPGAILFRNATGPVGDDDPLRELLAHVRDLGEKDLELAVSEARRRAVETPLAALALERLGTELGVGRG